MVWPSPNGWLDRLDKQLSRPFFYAQLGPFEYILSAPGAWFGVPLFCMSLGPVVMAALAATVRDTADAAMLRCLAALVLAVTALFWAALVQHSVSLSDHARAKNIGGIAIAYLPLKGKRSVPFLVLVPHATLAALFSSQAEGSSAAAAGAFFATAWMGANLLCEIGKKITRRERPCVALREELDRVPRRLPQLQTMMRHRSARASFPSGDSAGSAAFAMSCMLVSGRNEWCMLAAASACGRLFFHAHHLLDVMAGCAVGAGFTWALRAALGGWENCGWRHYAGVQCCFLVVWRAMHRFPQRGVADQ